jgi:hypothetical protein
VSEYSHDSHAALWQGVADYALGLSLDPGSGDLSALAATTLDLLSVDAACITGADGESLAAVAGDLPEVEALDHIQFTSACGPCATAIRAGEVVTVGDLSAAWPRWPRFTVAALDAGVLAVAAFPLARGGGRLAVLGLYSARTRAWAPEEVAGGQALAAMTAACVGTSARMHERVDAVAGLQQALDSRVVIEQAKGMLAAVEGIPLSDAFERMRQHARRRRIPIRNVAGAVVTLGFRPPALPGRRQSLH